MADPEDDQYFIDDYVEYASSRTDAPRIFHKYVAYMMLSCALGRKAYLEFAGDRVYPNLYMLLIAPSTMYRKSTSLNIAMNILKEVGDIRLPDDLSSESLVKILQKQGTGLIYSSEFLKILQMFKKEYAAQVKPILTDVYDVPSSVPVPFRMKSPTTDLESIERPCISIASATVLDWLLEAADADDLKGGFLARFIYIVATSKEPFMARPPGADPQKVAWFARRLRSVQSSAWNPTHQPITMSPEAGNMFDVWSENFGNQISSDPRCKDVESALGRLMIYTLKFALLECVMRVDMQISTTDLARAIVLTNECKENLILAMSELQDSANDPRSMLKKARKYLMSHPHTPRKDLMKSLNLYEKETEQIVSTLKLSGEIKVLEGRNGSMILDYKHHDDHDVSSDSAVRFITEGC